MKKSKLFLTALFAISALNTVHVSDVEAASTSAVSSRAREAALKIGPEKMIRFEFAEKRQLGNINYKSREGVSFVQKQLVDLYPDRPDLYKRAACVIGECLNEEGKYTQKEIERVVGYIMKLTEKYYGKQ